MGVDARWVEFPVRAWLRWHWPRTGDLYAITVTCESLSNCSKLRRREHLQMAATGFFLPTEPPEDDECEDEGTKDPEPPAPPLPAQAPTAARVQAARRLLDLEHIIAPTAEEVEEAFRRAARAVHPDRAAALAEEADGSWAMSQVL